MNNYPSSAKLTNLLQRFRCTYGTASTTSRLSLESFVLTERFCLQHVSNGDPAILYLYARYACNFRRTTIYYYLSNYRRPVPRPTWSRSLRALSLSPRPEVSLKLGGVEV